MDIVIRRQQVQWNIQQNSTMITINRTEKVETEGHFDESKTVVGPLTVRIFAKKQGNPKETSDLAGTKQTDANWGLLADYQADIKAGPNILDEFDVPGIGHFQISSVLPQIFQGQIVGFQADLEKVM